VAAKDKKREINVVPEEVIAKVKKRAKDNFKTGMNCAECVLEAVLANIDTNLPHETMCVMTGFGGGGGLFGDTCGALTGAMAALGAVYGRREVPVNPKAAGEELNGNPGLYRLFNRLPNEFKRRFGSTQCRLLTAQWRKTWLCRDHLQFCRNLTIEVAGLAAEMAIPKDMARWGSEPFGENVEGRE
jgi:C_GCAxxG_C_C family probable redox protein